MDPQEAVDLVDENTILVCAILGSVFLVWDARTRFLIETYVTELRTLAVR